MYNKTFYYYRNKMMYTCLRTKTTKPIQMVQYISNNLAQKKGKKKKDPAPLDKWNCMLHGQIYLENGVSLRFLPWPVAKVAILAWPMLQQRGWNGQSICLLCKCSRESTEHILLPCHFA